VRTTTPPTGQLTLFDVITRPTTPTAPTALPPGITFPTATVLLQRELDHAARTGWHLDGYDVARLTCVQVRLNYEAKLTKQKPKSLEELTAADRAARVTLYVHRKVNPARRHFEETLLAVWDALPADDRATLAAKFTAELDEAKGAVRAARAA
jgi:hypothetical protein